MSLVEYQRKRNFRSTKEPRGGSAKGSKKRLQFVVQKHDARHLHFDFRLEWDGVLKSWAVPKGPSLDPKQSRLAIEVEDHPLEYASFEGSIPDGDYGAGEVIVWDRGTWSSDDSVQDSLKRGKLHFRLEGERLRGEWLLIRTRSRGKQVQWLLKKLDDEAASTSVDLIAKHETSVVTGRKLQSQSSMKHSVRSAKESSKQTPRLVKRTSRRASVETPNFIPFKLPSLVKEAVSGPQWLHERKLDGYRMQLRIDQGAWQLRNRTGLDWSERFSQLGSQWSVKLRRSKQATTIIDGELVAMNAQGQPSFSRLQQAMQFPTETNLVFYAFDLLMHDGVDLREEPLLKRKEQLERLLSKRPLPGVEYLDHTLNDPQALIHWSQQHAQEGIVSKRIDRPYRSGRVTDWVKYKFRFRESLVVGGYELNEDDALSSLLLGYYDSEGKLQFAGRVGTGWSRTREKQILRELKPFTAKKSPFEKPIPRRSRSSQTRTSAYWLKPAGVAEIAFAEWTEGRILRQASLIELRTDAVPESIQGATIFADQQLTSAPPTQTNRPSNWKQKITHPDRVLYPESGITKQQVAEYLYKIAQWVLPHLKKRPVSLVRCPDGITGDHVFQRHPHKGFPESIKSIDVEGESHKYLMIHDVEGLIATAQVSALELHPWGSQIDRIDMPDRMVMDLDPDPKLDWSRVVEAALIVKQELDRLSLRSFVKTTGGKGLHVVVPLTRRNHWDQVTEFAKSFAESLESRLPKQFVANMSKQKRRDRIFIDFHRNRRGATCVAAYSLRARPGATVSTPLHWEELASITPDAFTITTIPERLTKLNKDPWAEMGKIKQSLPRFVKQ